ncbi:lytic transglycosylase domain-containing protein [Spongiactinospora sp. TRM90649]|uniref:lytic transglycosylase domain-containing protein n=1 Tax=Spongiactinospora sp. TRM90649 TaxID=3031114 RepID=UPI0023F61DB4|nr:lytic transglycosylase domain-containing protein [Spongiactinospora sp. TRM90649]MDF5757957.1 lytic transglycosylase domain-containing protein [Spongiactinospora sp. TRM90649]
MPRSPSAAAMPAVLAGLTAAIVLTILAGALYLMRTPASGAPVTPRPVGRGDLASGRTLTGLERLVPTTAPHAPPASPPASATTAPAIGGPGVTLTPPRVFAVSQASVPRATMHKISGLKHVQKAAAVDAGTVKVAGSGLSLLAVQPAEFRAWTPKQVADQPGVWEALVRGEFVADSKAVQRLGLVLGAEYQVDNGPRLRVAASAPLGLPGVDGIVGVETGRRLGLLPGVAVLVHGDEKNAATMGSAVRRALGSGAQVVTVGDGRSVTAGKKKNAPRAEPRAPRRVVVGRPGSYLELYRVSAQVCPGLSWTVLAAIGQVESSHGRNNGPSSAGALGPMQFMPATWKAYGVDGDGDGKADIWSPYDAVPSAANYLCANGANQGGKKLEKAIWFYNHSWDYVRKVMGVAAGYARQYS